MDRIENKCLNVPLVRGKFSSELVVEHNIMAGI
jgi:hypothetical protein